MPTSEHAQRIEMLAYRIWQQEGCPEGRAEENWCEAERQVYAAQRMPGADADGEAAAGSESQQGKRSRSGAAERAGAADRSGAALRTSP